MDCLFFNLPLWQHVPLYPGRQLQPLLCGVPEFLHASLLHARVSDRWYGHVPPQASTTVLDLVRLCDPLVPHWWLQAPHVDHEPTWQFRAPHGGGPARLRLLRLQGSVSRAKTSSTTVTAKTLDIHIAFLKLIAKSNCKTSNVLAADHTKYSNVTPHSTDSSASGWKSNLSNKIADI